MAKPLILLTNDDGFNSPGLKAAAEAVVDLGELIIVAPKEQQTGMGRALLPQCDGSLAHEEFEVKGRPVQAFSLFGSPAQAVLHGALEVCPRLPDLVVAGINCGENLGTVITLSGTIGAALEAANLGIPALAVSLEMPREYRMGFCPQVDFTAAIHFTRFFARIMLSMPRLYDVDVLKVDIPYGATPEIPWRITRLSRQRYHYPKPRPRRSLKDKAPMGYEVRFDLATLEPDSDIYAVAVEKVVSVTPLSLDLTSRIDFHKLQSILTGAQEEK
ncbi:MAG: 5'/3'-nucleotidase SurE [Anaerolineae bacterium]|nr:5'/3'-nucleotidase SurE [Anaerolineae bacterium]MDW8102058.1 5'/3'-nucleotidase SurE [Anaerolineae bacterium]